MELHRAEFPILRASQYMHLEPLTGSSRRATSFSEQKVAGVSMASAGLGAARHLAACRAASRSGWYRQDNSSRNSIRRWSKLATRGHPHGLPGMGGARIERLEAEEAEEDGEEVEEGIEVIEIVNGYPAAGLPPIHGKGSGGEDGLASRHVAPILQAGRQQVGAVAGQAEVTASYGMSGESGVQEREVGRRGVAMGASKRPPPVKVKYTMLGARSKSGGGGGFPANVQRQEEVGEDVRARSVHGHSHGSGDNHHNHSHSSHSHTHDHHHPEHDSNSDDHHRGNHHNHHAHSHHDHHGHHHHNHGSHSHNHDHHHHHHHHHHNGHDGNPPQRAIQWVADRTFLSPLADLLRENALAAGVSLTLCVLASIVPLLPLPLFRPPITPAGLQNGLVLGALSLTAVPAGLDAALDIAGGSINIHVLMAVAGLASVAMGNALEGALLLAMFAAAHIAEEYFTERAMGDLQSLEDSNPDTALLIDAASFSTAKAEATAQAIASGLAVTAAVAAASLSVARLTHSEVDVDDVRVGDLLLVKAGEVVPVDGTVRVGRSLVSMEHLTGEAQPVGKREGDNVAGGSRTVDGFLVVEATKSWNDSTLMRISQLTAEARSHRPPLQRWLDTFSERYSQAVVAVAAAVVVLGPVLFGWPLWSSPGVRGSLYRGLAVMVVASPCALAVAPLAYFAAVTACAAKGVLLKGGHALDAIAACDTVAFDKTGTLTTGQLTMRCIQPIHTHTSEADQSLLGANGGATSPQSSLWAARSSSTSSAASLAGDELREGEGFGSQLGQVANGVAVECRSGRCEMEAVAVAAALEQAAVHPIARAVLCYADSQPDLPAINVDKLVQVPGRGVRATVSSSPPGQWGPHEARIGSLEFVAEGVTGDLAFSPSPPPLSPSTISTDSTFSSPSSPTSSNGAAAASPPHSPSHSSSSSSSAGGNGAVRSASSVPSDLVRAAISVGQKVTVFHFEDEVRPEAAEAVRGLQHESGMNMRVALLTGDHSASAQRVAASLGISDVSSELKPEDKLSMVQAWAERKDCAGLMMVGEGINDAPALAAATVGVVLAGRASATAVAAADVLLLRDNLSALPFLVAKARQTTGLVKQSVALSLGCILLALLPAMLGQLPLWLSVLLHEGGTLLVCLNSARALQEPNLSPANRGFFPLGLPKLPFLKKRGGKGEEEVVRVRGSSSSA